MTEITAEQFRAARVDYGSRQQACDLLDVSDRQLRRWEHGQSPPPRAAYRLLRLLAGDLGLIRPAWDGWTLGPDSLRSPEGEVYPRVWFYQLPHHFGRLHAEERQLRQQVAQLTAIVSDLRDRLRQASDQSAQLSLLDDLSGQMQAHQQRFVERRRAVRA